MTLIEAINMRTRQAALAGWSMGKKRWIEMQADGHAILRISWINPGAALTSSEGDSSRAGDHTIRVDAAGMPAGVTALQWSALPDTADLIDRPTLQQINEAARHLGCRHVDHLQGTGIDTYCMVVK